MKNFNLPYLLILVLLAISFTGCNDDFLTRTPLDEISDETFWETENDLRVFNNSLYHMTLNEFDVPILMGHPSGSGAQAWRGSLWFQDGFSDNLAPHHDRHTYFQQVRAGKHNIPTSAQDFGYRGWNFVRSANVGLENYDRASVSEEIINRYAAEARLFRGWFYAEKVSKFGDVPWVDRPLNIDSEELYAARTPREEAMEYVLEDLQFATEFLPDDWGDGDDPGRLNRWDALLVLSRVALFEGSWRKYHDGEDPDRWFQIAADAAREVMDNSPHSVYSTEDPENDFNAYHRLTDLAGNPEVMYWRKYEHGVYDNLVHGYFGYTGGATKSFVDDFLATDGLPITLSPLYQGDEQIEDLFENRDPRLRQTILHPDDSDRYRYNRDDGRDYPRMQGMGGFTTATGYHIIKVYNADEHGLVGDPSILAAINLRYGEVLLNYAEAMAELGTITQNDLDISINLLRDRVDMPHLELDPPMDPRYADDGISPLLVEIRRERRIELFLEGHRYNDLRRWGQGSKLEEPTLGIRWNDAAAQRYEGAEVQTAQDPVSGNTYIDVYQGTDWADPVFDESRHYLWPIPLSVLSQNPDIGQNPGW